MAEVTKTQEQRTWEAEDAARTLIHAKEILNNAPLLKRAKLAAKKIAAEKAREALAAKSVAGVKNPVVKKKSPVKKTTVQKKKAEAQRNKKGTRYIQGLGRVPIKKKSGKTKGRK